MSHGEPCFFVRDKRALCYFHDNHNGDGRTSLWCPLPDGVQDEMVSGFSFMSIGPPRATPRESILSDRSTDLHPNERDTSLCVRMTAVLSFVHSTPPGGPSLTHADEFSTLGASKSA
jgi:hypothetical protein